MNAAAPSPPLSSPDLLLALILSAALGAFVGFLRQWTDWAQPHRDISFGGVRTYSLWSMIGCAAAAAPLAGGALLLVVLLLIGGHEIVAMGRLARRRMGSTSFAAVLLTVLTGALVSWNQRAAAIVITAATAIILGTKRPVHAWTRSFTREDVHATLQFAAVTGLILPLVPNEDLGPFKAFNPYTTWLMVVLISTIGFGGYVAMRWLGTRAGLVITSLLGGIASSTATTLSLARHSRANAAASSECALGIIVACGVLFVRLLIILAVVNPAIVTASLVPFGIMAAPGVLAAFLLTLLRRGAPRSDLGVPGFRNPLNLGIALKFGALFAAISFLVKMTRELQWTGGLLPLSFVSGLTNMDAITISLGRIAADGPSGQEIVRAIVLAAVGNTILKAVLAVVLGSAPVRRIVGITLGLMAAAGTAVVFAGP